MDTIEEASFETMAEKFLGTGFPRHLSGAVCLHKLSPDTRNFILRGLDLMKRSGYSITQFNPVLIRWLSATIPGILPSAWGGHIPPITVPGRHRNLDDYVAGQGFPTHKGQHIFLDIGCGFPPVTTVDTACRFPDWQVYGVDRSFADYVLYDTRGQYACFNREGEFLYFQPSMDVPGQALYSNPDCTKKRFCQLFEDLFFLLEKNDPLSSETVEKDGNKLIRNHIMDFQAHNLKFIKSDMTDLEPMPAKIVRCMNIFIYFTRHIKKEMLHHIKDHLEDDGLLIIGTNSFGIQSRYVVYKKKIDDLVLHEFAFSLDNLGHISIMPWFSLHDKDPEATLLAELSRTIRSASSFWTRFSSHLDQLLEYHGFCKRKTDGFLHFPKEKMLPNKFLRKNTLLWREMKEKGYLEGAVDVLKETGYDPWVNPAGDIAIRPSVAIF